MSASNSLKVTILGSGTSTGVPMPGCECSVCHSTDPRNRRLRASALITYGKQHFIIDAGPDFRQQALMAAVPWVDGVLFTHGHADHVLGIDDLRGYNYKQKGAIPCYGSSDTLQQIRRIFFYVFDRDPLHLGGAVSNLMLRTLENFVPIDLLGLSVTPFPLLHGNMNVTGFKFANFAYATDCHLIPKESLEILQGTEILVLDGLRAKSHNTHMTIAEAIQTGEELGVKKLYLIHMNHSVDYQSVSSQLPAWVELCYDGLEIRLG